MQKPGGNVFVVRSANAHKHAATVCLQIPPCGLLLGLSSHFPVCCSLTLTLSHRCKHSHLQKLCIWYKCEHKCSLDLRYLRRERSNINIKWETKQSTTIQPIHWGGKCLFTTLWWKTATGSVLYRQRYADTSVGKKEGASKQASKKESNNYLLFNWGSSESLINHWQSVLLNMGSKILCLCFIFPKSLFHQFI